MSHYGSGASNKCTNSSDVFDLFEVFLKKSSGLDKFHKSCDEAAVCEFRSFREEYPLYIN